MSVDTLTREARDAFAGYAEPDDRPPFRTLAALTAVFNAGFAGALFAAKLAGQRHSAGRGADLPLLPWLVGVRRLPRRPDARAARDSSGSVHADRADALGLPADRLQGGGGSRARRGVDRPLGVVARRGAVARWRGVAGS